MTGLTKLHKYRLEIMPCQVTSGFAVNGIECKFTGKNVKLCFQNLLAFLDFMLICITYYTLAEGIDLYYTFNFGIIIR